MTRLVFFANNRLGWRVARLLKEHGAQIAAVVVHPPNRARFRGEIVDVCGPDTRVIEAPALHDATTIAQLREAQPDLGLSAAFGYIVRAPVLTLFPRGVINIHTGYLPYNRGAYPNVWPIIDGSPAGVALHYMDEGIDTGPIISRQRVPVLPTDTGETLYERLEDAAVQLIAETWPLIDRSPTPLATVPNRGGSFHRKADVDSIDRIDLGATVRAGDLINLLRARTFSGYRGAYFEEGPGRRVYLRLFLEYDEEHNDKQRAE